MKKQFTMAFMSNRGIPDTPTYYLCEYNEFTEEFYFKELKYYKFQSVTVTYKKSADDIYNADFICYDR